MSGSVRIVDGAGGDVSVRLNEHPVQIEVTVPEGLGLASQLQVTLTSYEGETTDVDLERVEGTTTFRSDPINPTEELDLGGGEVFTAEFAGDTASARSFTNVDEAKWWMKREQASQLMGKNARIGSDLTFGRRHLLENYPPSEERDELVRQIDAKLEKTRAEQAELQKAFEFLDNDELLLKQQWAGAGAILDGLLLFQGTSHVNERLERAKDDVWQRIVDGYEILIVGGAEFVADLSGAGSAYALISGENIRGREVTWQEQTIALIDVVTQGLVDGLAIKGALDRMMTSAGRHKLTPADVPKTYTGAHPETHSPLGSLVDPGTMGMPESAISAITENARRNNHVILVRPTSPGARPKLDAGHQPKPEFLKSKTTNEYDVLLGMDPEAISDVAFFEPKTSFFEDAMRASGMPEAEITVQIGKLHAGERISAPPGFTNSSQWDSTVGRFHHRTHEFNGSIGDATRAYVDKGVIRIENGVVIDVATGMPFTGDHDLFDFLTVDGKQISMGKHLAAVDELKDVTFVMHPAHARWDPQRSQFPPGAEGDAKYADARAIYSKIIDSHAGGEILIAFTPNGFHVATFSNTPLTPIQFGPLLPLSSIDVPVAARYLAKPLLGSAVEPITYDDDSKSYIDAADEFRTDMFEPSGFGDDLPELDLTAGAAEPERKSKWKMPLVIGGGFGALGLILMTVVIISNSGDEQPVTPPAVVADAEPEQDSQSEPDSPPVEPIESEASDAQQTETASEQPVAEEPVVDDEPEQISEPPVETELCNGCDPVGDAGGSGAAPVIADEAMAAVVEQAEAATDVVANSATKGSYIFTMQVAGDGQAVSAADTTKWYNPRFIVNNDRATNSFDPGGFSVDVKVERDGSIDGRVFDENNSLLPDPVVEGRWLDASTLEVTVTDSGIDVDLVRGRVELSVRVMDGDGVTVATFDDDASWEADG